MTKNAYRHCTTAELADSLDGFADGLQDELGQMLTEAASRLRAPVYLGQMSSVAGYTFTVVETSEKAALKALKAEWRRAVKVEHVNDVTGDYGPLEYYGAYALAMTPGKVEWL